MTHPHPPWHSGWLPPLLLTLGALGCSSAVTTPLPADAALSADNGVPADGGVLADVAVPPDTGTSPDAPRATDAGVTPGTDASSPPAGCITVHRTCADVMSTFTLDPTGATGVTVTCDATAGTFVLRSTGVPNYTATQRTPNAIADQSWAVTFPLNPVCTATPADVVNSRGPVGFMINGVPFYGPQDAMGRDAVRFEGASFDDCEGHADMSCSYHYHEEPRCVFGLHDTASAHRQADGHPAVIGYALDGFAVYASYTPDAGTVALDRCNGHADAIRGYHYHATSTSPYLLGCTMGVASGHIMRSMPLCTMTAGTGDGGTVTPTGDGGMAMGPPACTTTAECAGRCPPGAMGCTCVPQPMSAGSACVPTCNATGDCPRGARGPLVCDPAHHICHP